MESGGLLDGDVCLGPFHAFKRLNLANHELVKLIGVFHFSHNENIGQAQQALAFSTPERLLTC